MLAPGPRRKWTPLARASRPISVPTRSASCGFHVAASPTPPAIAVAGPKLRTPSGPSAIFIRGTPRRLTSRTKKPSVPPSRSNFSSRVICLRMSSTRCSTPCCGAAVCARTCGARLRRRERKTTVVHENFFMASLSTLVIGGRLRLRWVGEIAHGPAPLGGRRACELRTFVGRDDQLAERGQEGKFERRLRLRHLGERGQTRVAPLGRGRDAAAQIVQGFEPDLPRRREVVRERPRLGERGRAV